MYTPEQIIEIMREHYIAASGLGRIDRDDTTVLSDGVESCRNENGILFLAYMLAQGVEAGVQLTPDAVRAYFTMKSLEVTPGLFQRQPDGSYPYERHDNAVGVVAICSMRGDRVTPAQMISWWWTHWFTFNDKDPDKFKKEQLRQPGELALYYAAAGRRPPMFFWLWLLVGILLNGYRKTPEAPQARLTWLRTWVINRHLKSLGPVQRFLYRRVLAYWTKRTEEKHANIWNFPEGHPICLFRELGRNGE